MATNKKLELYTKSLRALKDFRDKHAKVFGEYESLQIAMVDAEAVLKEEVRANVKANIANEFVRVTYSPAYKSSYSIDVIDRMATPKMKKAMEEEGAIIRAVDKVKFEEMVDRQIIPVEIKQEAFEESEQTARISIKEA